MKSKRWILPSIVAVLVIALVVTGVWGYNQYRVKNRHEIALQNSYQRMFYSLKGHVENVQVNLSKALLADSKAQNVLLFSQIMQQAYSAEEKLSQLPISHKDTAKTEKFLNQVADYCYAIAQDSLEGKPINQENRNALMELQNYTNYLSKELSNVHKKLKEGIFKVGTLEKREKQQMEKANEDMLNANFVKLEEQMTKTPELIYDGPFSDKTLNVKPKGLGKKKISLEEAKKIALDFIEKENAGKIVPLEEGKQMDETARIPAYTFSIQSKEGEDEAYIYIGVSKTGGKIVWMENTKPVSNKKVSMEQAQKKARKFLENKGYKNMEPNYSLRYDNIGVFNFAYQENDITIYPDLVKVKVALDDGEIIGIDATPYLKAHHDRDIPEPKITKEQARASVKTTFQIDSIRLAIIPKTGIKEVLCYEFKGKYRGSDFIVYVDALTGQETKILKIIKDENGTLTF